MPPLLRPEKAEPYRPQILELMNTSKGNLVRVREELAARGVSLSYSTLTAFCHRHGIGQPPPVAAGRYEFQPGEEMQHDTSPHEVQLAGQRRKVQTAAAVLAYSRMLFFQMYPTFQRFDCKVFLTEALVFALRQLLRLVREYPREPLRAAVQDAAHYGLYDLDRVERMILRRVARDYFLLEDDGGDREDH